MGADLVGALAPANGRADDARSARRCWHALGDAAETLTVPAEAPARGLVSAGASVRFGALRCAVHGVLRRRVLAHDGGRARRARPASRHASAFAFPSGERGPVERPPCILHRRFQSTAGALQAWPSRQRAPQSGGVYGARTAAICGIWEAAHGVLVDSLSMPRR